MVPDPPKQVVPPVEVGRVETGWFVRMRAGFGVPKYQLRQVRQLEQHVLHRLQEIAGAASTGDSTRLHDWVASRFTYPLRSLMLQASRNSRWYMGLNFLVIGGGFATSGIAIASGHGSIANTTAWIVFAIGLLVALAGGFNQLYRPGYRATEKNTLVVELEEEGWSFANATGSYPMSNEKSFELFDQRVSAILRRAAQVASLEADPAKDGTP